MLSLTYCCSTITGDGTTQSIAVKTFNSHGTEVTGVQCELKNDVGTWYVKSPGIVTVHRSNRDLHVTGTKKGLDVGTASVTSATKGNMFGNIILGGGIGAIVDHSNGSAYEYPHEIKIYMGRSNQMIATDTDSKKESSETAE